MIGWLQAMAENLETGEWVYIPFRPRMPKVAELREVLNRTEGKSFIVWETINGMMIRREG